MKPRILLVDCFDSFTHNIFHYLDDLNRGNCHVVRYDKFNPDDLANFSHFLISPGPGLPVDYPLISQALSTYAMTKRILGVCLGLQAIVVHFGGSLLLLDRVMHGRATTIRFSPSPLFRGLESPLLAGHYHSWVANEEGFPACLKVTSKNEGGLIMSLEHRSLPIHGFQFHPESVMTEGGKAMLANWLSLK
ncbi:MAG: aminodeoxychorismate/anthranilate synthase component II [Vicingaceae bacterium]